MTFRKLVAILLVSIVAISPALAWNAAGHRIIAALTWQEMEPALRERTTELLKKHPDFAKWQSAYDQGPKNIDLGAYLLMRASVWPDEIRRKGNPHDHPTWHYSNYPIRPPELPTHSIPQKDDVLFAIEHCRSIVSDDQADAGSRAIHFAWLLHLIGDLHQPLHAGALTNGDYPKGDKGGNDFWVIANKAPINLHTFWDGLLGRSTNMRELYNEAARLKVAYPDLSLRHRKLADPTQWAYESRYRAMEFAYLRGKLRGGKDKESAVRLPEDYPKEAKIRAEYCAYIAGARTAERLGEMFRGPR